MGVQTVNPATGEVIKDYDFMSNQHIEEVITQAHTAFQDWRKLAVSEREKLMAKAAEVLKKNKEEYAALITKEMGKSITSARAEIDKCAWICEHYSKNTANYLKPRIVKTEMSKSIVTYEPRGPIFSIMPWNFPFWQVFRFAAPNITAGNVGILSHAPISTGAAQAIEDVFHQAGFPKGIFTSVIIDNDQAANIIADKRIIGVTLTGSERAGKAVASEAGQSLKKVVLELGGSDPYVILEDADVAEAAKVCINDRMATTGQVCISAKRLIVVDSVYEEFLKVAQETLATYKPSDPTKDDCNFGPMARSDLRDQVHEQVQKCIAKGATCLAGGKKVEGAGFFYEPTLLVDVAPGMPAYDEEIFGPVAAIIRAKDEADALRIANDSPFGLGAAVFTTDVKRGEEIATNELHAGVVAVNTAVGSDPRLPFGGINLSGYGRECAEEGIREFVNTKTVNIK